MGDVNAFGQSLVSDKQCKIPLDQMAYFCISYILVSGLSHDENLRNAIIAPSEVIQPHRKIFVQI